MRGPRLMAVVVAFAVSAAKADPPPREIGEIQDRSSSITTLRVNEVVGGSVRATVEEIRGAVEPGGDHTTLHLPVTYAPPVDSRLIRYCVIGSCPEWVGLQRDGFHVVRSIDPWEEVAPGIIDDLGTDVCLRARVLWLDQPGRLGRVEGSFDRRTGHGLLWGKPVGRPRHARMTMGSGLGPWADEAVTVTVEGRVRLVGGPLERGRDCYQVDLLPVAPLARTPAELAALLSHGRPRAKTIARGTATIEGRTTALTLAEAPDGRIVVRTPRLDTPTTATYDETQFSVTIEAAGWSFDLDGISPPLPGAGVGSAIALTLRLKKELRGAIHRAPQPSQVGSFVLR